MHIPGAARQDAGLAAQAGDWPAVRWYSRGGSVHTAAVQLPGAADQRRLVSVVWVLGGGSESLFVRGGGIIVPLGC